MTAERHEDPRAAEEAEAAAEEAGAIGGPGGVGPESDADPADRAVEEGGGGEAEGFEQAEDDLIRQASHDDGSGSPATDAFTPEEESDLSGAEYGEGDSERPPDS